MSATLDLYYLDEFEQVITLDRVMRAIRGANIAPHLIDNDILNSKLAEVIATQMPIKGIQLARGKFPCSGKDATLTFYFQAYSDSSDVDTMYSSRKVAKGDILCRKSPSSVGDYDGYNVFGKEIAPRSGADIVLISGENAELSIDEMDVVARSEGVVVVSRVVQTLRTISGIKEQPISVTIKVDPILKLNGNEHIDITTAQAVEITGNLTVGSRILSQSEVFVRGNVESGVSIVSSDNILIKGNVSDAKLSSHGSIVTSQSVSGSDIYAQGQVTIGGDIRGSSIVGETVSAAAASGSRIVARKSVTLDRIDVDEGNLISTICVGMNDFFVQRLQENQSFLEAAHANMERIKMVVGEQIFESVTGSNMQAMLMKLLSRLHLDSSAAGRKQAEVYRKLIEAIPPTRALVKQKERECLEIARKLSGEAATSDGMIIVKERVTGKAVTSINGMHQVVQPSDHGINMGCSNGHASA